MLDIYNTSNFMTISTVRVRFQFRSNDLPPAPPGIVIHHILHQIPPSGRLAPNRYSIFHLYFFQVSNGVHYRNNINGLYPNINP